MRYRSANILKRSFRFHRYPDIQRNRAEDLPITIFQGSLYIRRTDRVYRNNYMRRGLKAYARFCFGSI